MMDAMLARMLERIGPLRGYSATELADWYEKDGKSAYRIERISADERILLFALPVRNGQGEQIDPEFQMVVLLNCFRDEIISDCFGYRITAEKYHRPEIYEELKERSEWLKDAYELADTLYFEEGHDPGFVFLYGSAYVSEAYRGQSRFTRMLAYLQDFLLAKEAHGTTVYEVLSLDPDVACYGPDASAVPYVYRYEVDEPRRRYNREIAEHLGFETVRLDPVDGCESSDGSRRWYAFRRRKICFLG